MTWSYTEGEAIPSELELDLAIAVDHLNVARSNKG